MKNEFIGFYMPNQDELKSAWKSENTIFVFDTNVLLKLYSYQPNTLNDFFSILKKLGNRIWIPHQVGLEFQNRRLGVKLKEKQKFIELKKEIDTLLKTEDRIKKIFLDGRFPALDEATTNLFNGIRTLIDNYKTVLATCDDSQPSIRTHDVIREKIDIYFKGKVGSPFKKEILDEIYTEGEERYKNKIPPGFKDSSKDPNDDYFYKGIQYKRKFGDLILWKQLIEKVKNDENIKNVIFITDDEKEDWWFLAQENGTKAIGPLANLTHEIIEQGNINLFHMYNTFAFFEASNEFLSVRVTENSISDAKFIHENESKNIHHDLKSIRNLDIDQWIRTLDSIRHLNDLNNDLNSLASSSSRYLQEAEKLSRLTRPKHLQVTEELSRLAKSRYLQEAEELSRLAKSRYLQEAEELGPFTTSWHTKLLDHNFSKVVGLDDALLEAEQQKSISELRNSLQNSPTDEGLDDE